MVTTSNGRLFSKTARNISEGCFLTLHELWLCPKLHQGQVSKYPSAPFSVVLWTKITIMNLNDFCRRSKTALNVWGVWNGIKSLGLFSFFAASFEILS